jgi:hypothetical protein
MSRIEAVAYHEAGHVVVGLRQGVPNRLLEASIVPDEADGSLGHVRRGHFARVRVYEGPDENGKARVVWRDWDPGSDQRLAERRLRPFIVELYAGVIAEKRYTGRRYSWRGAGADLEQASDLLGHIVGSERQGQALSEFLWVVAEDEVEWSWRDVERVARALLVHRTLSGAAIRKLLLERPTTTVGAASVEDGR